MDKQDTSKNPPTRSPKPESVSPRGDHLSAPQELVPGSQQMGQGSLAAQASTLQRMYPAQQQAMLKQLSRTHGNHHVQRLVSTMRQNEVGSIPAAPVAAPRPPLIQAKRHVGVPDDQCEPEADAVADPLMRLPAAAPPPPPDDAPDMPRPHLSFPPSTLLQRTSTEEGASLSPETERGVGALKGGGSPLPDSERSFFEERFDQDFSEVRLHTDDAAVQLSQDLEARAFTVGNDIAFNQGEYQPGTTDGRKLLAHELTHTVQQTGGKLARKAAPADGESKQTDSSSVLAPDGQVQRFRQAEQPIAPSAPDLSDEPTVAALPPRPEEATSSTATESPPSPATSLEHSSTTLDPSAPPVAEPMAAAPSTEGAVFPSEAVTAPSADTAPPLPNQPDAETPGAHMGAGSTSSPLTEEKQAAAGAEATLLPQGEAKEAAALPTEVKQSGEGAGGVVPALYPASPSMVEPVPASPSAAELPKEAGTSGGSVQPVASSPSPAPAAASTAAPSVVAATEEGDAGAGAIEPEEPELQEAAARAAEVEISVPASERESDLALLGESVGGGDVTPGGGGGGGAIQEKEEPPAPDVSQADPAQAMGSLSGLSPVTLQGALGGVAAAATNFTGKQREELAANPPQMERPTGAPAKVEAPVERPDPLTIEGEKQVERAPEGQEVPPPEPEPLPPAPPNPAQRAAPPGDAKDLQSSLNQIPTSDPSLTMTTGPAPEIELEGNADPAQAEEQHTELLTSVHKALGEGQSEVAQPMGEHEIFPVVPHEILKAEIPNGGGAKAAAASAEAAVGAAPGALSEQDKAVSVIAQEQSGAEIQAAVAQAQGNIASQQQDHTLKVAEERAKSSQAIDQLVAANSAEQSQARESALTEVQGQRDQWNQEIHQLVDDAKVEADATKSQGLKDVEQEQLAGNQEAQKHIDEGNQQAEAARQEGEREAKQEQEKGKQEADSGGFFGWLADKAKSFFDGIKQAIQAAIEKARQAVRAAIETAKKLAVAAIEKARKAVVGIIRKVGDALIAIGDRVLAAFPTLRDKFRNAINDAVNKAEQTVNALADKLKEDVTQALDALGQGIDSALGLLEQGLLAAVDLVKGAVDGAIQGAKAFVDTLGTFAVLIADIAANPGQWLSNLAAGVMDGIQNHLWAALKSQVTTWFESKLEEVLGLGKTIWDLLMQGGFTMEAIGKMVLEALKEAIPGVLIQILIEKLVSMIVPAAGAVMAIIEGVQAAWNSISSILQAIDRFVTFLKSVKSGQSGPAFAGALAAAAVAVIDFVSNWLLAKLATKAKGVASKIKKMAQKVGKRIKKGLSKVGKKLFGKDKKRKKNKHDKDQDREEEKDDKDKAKREKQALAAAERALRDDEATPESVRGKLPGIRSQYRLKKPLKLKQDRGDFYHVQLARTDSVELEWQGLSKQELNDIILKAAEHHVEYASQHDQGTQASLKIQQSTVGQLMGQEEDKGSEEGVKGNGSKNIKFTQGEVGGTVVNKRLWNRKNGVVVFDYGVGRYKDMARKVQEICKHFGIHVSDFMELFSVVKLGGAHSRINELLPAKKKADMDKRDSLIKKINTLKYTETSLDPRNVLYNYMMTDMMSMSKDRGKNQFEELGTHLSGELGSHPMTMIGAAKGSTASLKDIEDQGKSKVIKSTKYKKVIANSATARLKHRYEDGTAAYFIRFLKMKLEGVKFKNKEEARRRAEKELMELGPPPKYN